MLRWLRMQQVRSALIVGANAHWLRAGEAPGTEV